MSPTFCDRLPGGRPARDGEIPNIKLPFDIPY